MKPHSGFTLIELSIVLVIIGLLVGGVMVGRDLIHAAQVRATIKQTEQFDAAINTFRNKYNCLPGDCTKPSEFGFTRYVASFGTHGTPAGDGNGDGKISDDDPASPYEIENAFWWLQNAGLVEGVNISATNGGGAAWATVIPAAIDSFQPVTDGSNDGWNLTYATWNVTYVDLAIDITNANQPTGNNFFPQSGHYYLLSSDIQWGYPTAITPADAFAIDAKMDDGLPRSGRVLATGNDVGDYLNLNTTNQILPLFDPSGTVGGTIDQGAPGATSPYCVTSQSPPQYNVQNTNYENDTTWTAVGPYCGLGIKASF